MPVLSCESDVVQTYRIWLIYQCFLGVLTPKELENSERQLRDFVRLRKDTGVSTQIAAGLNNATAESG